MKEIVNKMQQTLIPQEWLYNPVVYTQISGDFSLMQQKILIGVLERMQERILYTINEKEQNKTFPSLFPEDDLEEILEVDIEPKKLGIAPDHYMDLEEALRGLSKITIAFPKYDKGEVRYIIAPLFSRIEMTRIEMRRTGKVCVKMLRENIEDFFSLAHGYTVHLARITHICKKKRTPRLYIFLSAFRDLGHKEVDYQALLKFLGVDQETFDADNQANGYSVKENPFRKYNKVRSHILEPSKQEMDAYMNSGKIDFSFCYEPIYRNDHRRGNPSYIRFTIIKGILAEERDSILINQRQIMAFVNTIYKWCPDIDKSKLLNLCKLVSEQDIEDFLDFGYREIRRVLDKNNTSKIDDYILHILNLRIKEIDNDKTLHRKKEIEETWKQCRFTMFNSCTIEYSRRIVSSLSFVSWEETSKTLTIRIKNKEDYQWIVQTSVVEGLVKPAFSKHFSDDVNLAYIIDNKA